MTGSADGRIPGQMPEHSMWDSCFSEMSGCHSSTGLYFYSFLFLESPVDPGVSGAAQGRERGSPGPMCPSCSSLAEQEGHFLETPPKTPSFYRSLPSAGYGIVALGKRGGVFVRVWCWGDTPCAVLDTTFQPHGCAGLIPFAAPSKFSPVCGVPALGTSPAF